MENEEDIKSLEERAIIIPVHSKRLGRIFLHLYVLNDTLYFTFSSFEDGAILAKDIPRYCLLPDDAGPVVGGALYVMLEGKRSLYANTKDLKSTLRYLDPQSLQLAINAAFEPTQTAFEGLSKRMQQRLNARAKDKAKQKAKRWALKMKKLGVLP